MQDLFQGHFEGGDVYHSDEEVEEWRKKTRFRDLKRFSQMGIMTEEQMEKIRSEVSKVEEAVKFAEESPWPSGRSPWTYTRERGGDEDEEVNVRAAISEALRQEMSAFNVYVIGEDVGIFGSCLGARPG